MQAPANTPKASTLQPVPDPEAKPGVRMPELLNPHDRTAVLTHRTDVAGPLRWAGSLPTHTAVYQTPAAPEAKKVWAERGYHGE